VAKTQTRRRQEKALNHWMTVTYEDAQKAVVKTEKTKEEWEAYRLAQITQLRAKLELEPLTISFLP
jgi:hypothetical protein